MKVGKYKRTADIKKKISDALMGRPNLKIRGRKAPNRSNLIGQRFNRLLVTDFDSVRGEGRKRHAYWKTVCDCGSTKIASGNSLNTGSTQSCGCLAREKIKKGLNFQHGYCSNGRPIVEYELWNRAKKRAMEKGLEFSIKVSDIFVPKICPLLEMPIARATKKIAPNSVSLDRINPNRGYTPDNIWVVSQRANSAKQDLVLEELKMLVENLEHKIIEQKIHEDRKDEKN